MILKALKRFRDRTYERYEKEHRRERPAWMEKVMEIHEKSRFLFYYDESPEEKEEPFSMLVLGETVRGSIQPGERLYLYSGEGRLLGSGRPLTSPEEKEEGRKGLLTPRRNEFRMEILDCRGFPAGEMNHREKIWCFGEISTKLSLISDYLHPQDEK